MPAFGGVNAHHDDMKSRNRMQRHVMMRFFPQGAGAVVNASNVGRGATIARTGVGRFVVTLDGPYPQLVHGDTAVAHATLVYNAVIVGTTTDATGITAVTIQVYDNAASPVAADVAAAATSSVSFSLVFLATTQNGI